MRTPRPINKTEENKEKKMNSEWSLDELYKGFDDPKLAADLTKYDEMIAKINEFAAKISDMQPLDDILNPYFPGTAPDALPLL